MPFLGCWWKTWESWVRVRALQGHSKWHEHARCCGLSVPPSPAEGTWKAPEGRCALGTSVSQLWSTELRESAICRVGKLLFVWGEVVCYLIHQECSLQTHSWWAARAKSAQSLEFLAHLATMCSRSEAGRLPLPKAFTAAPILEARGGQ